jgi:hypothetical protein
MQPLVSSLSASDSLVQPLRKDIKICIAKQAKQIFQYKKFKIKLYKNNAAIWYKKACRIKQLTPNYINIRVNGNNTRSQKTKNIAI